MSVAYNTGDQYTGMSGTSMATPGAAELSINAASKSIPFTI